jgi:hypothetical protein
MSAPPDPTPPSQTPQTAAGNGTDDPHRSALLNEWRRRHGSDWVRADDLSTTVRRMIDERERLPAVRQKLPRLVVACPELETEVRGNRAERVTFYRLARIETPGLEG